MTVWELGVSQTPGQRALSLLAAASADGFPSRESAQLTLGQCDERLLTLREWTFGPRLDAVVECPVCSQALEFTVDGAALRVAPTGIPSHTLVSSVADWEVQYRLPNSVDIAGLDPEAANDSRRQQLLGCCVLSARRAGATVAAKELPPEVADAIAERMAEADPQAEMQLALTCPDCAHKWDSPLDIVSFFWSEINAWAARILNDVYILASAFGWREADILAMSSARRTAYLELAQR